MSCIEWVTQCWGVNKAAYCVGYGRRRFATLFGDDDMHAFSGLFRSKRRAKKEITHYINRGLNRGPFHGANAYLKRQSAAGGK